ncbi:NADH-dependent flavin oxidoreductase [Lactiplantibacillus mudanjiangensis]|uniref:NADH-dependent flavin oxidoreductase [Lactobacillus coryniformis subsp. torquens DSM = KCTC 3535] n=1 Tax=Lactiplantibacillus mudanjiangensis TaxID=1296538 RepID=A0A660DUR2_9LACO|nr:NADH-dependent flavin oxidoreductase [Lactiplantibacillus mudanjiangensis]VDG20013.1 NADH-dependent flavin oxidoreductase [Lactobacillus coryniformis subsp. torquens DSM = KCTC 3535] [Lactiplantibacillus mudanjiangensis]VDG26173.1 NADH-dependent flavin oxidoreductase [Lactobacillus coryniformis subsp. torquens DSM = KCTC 3535] [Lactiplantibacillus mudanjiangensis]VDG27326.1 NADH-dependent flavin oxidoreductase [Lactobacillus coryniformis subsp. torquens DSM = KCTC 3535] [Lactiplantibacillus m
MVEFTDELTLKSGVTLKNRLMMSPMTTRQSFFDGQVTTDEIHYYEQRAHGVGAIITGAANVQAGGKGWPGELSIADDAMIPRLHDLATAIQNAGAKAIVQIVHAGRMTEKATLGGVQTVSASAIPAARPNAETPRAMTDDEVQATIAAFGDATRRAIQAGFDGIELHGANTYLIQQFFSPHSNRRTDQWGGDREKRTHFIKAMLDVVFAAVKQYADRPFIVGYRVSPEEFETPGIRFADTLYLIDELAKYDLDYLHLSLNTYDRVTRAKEYQAKTALAYVYEHVAGRLPVVGVGAVRNRDDVTNVLAHADLVAVGEQLLFDPTWAEKLIDHHDDEILTGTFADLFAKQRDQFNLPLADFLAERYQSTPNM